MTTNIMALVSSYNYSIGKIPRIDFNIVMVFFQPQEYRSGTARSSWSLLHAGGDCGLLVCARKVL